MLKNAIVLFEGFDKIEGSISDHWLPLIDKGVFRVHFFQYLRPLFIFCCIYSNDRCNIIII